MGINKKWSDLFIFILYVILGFSLSVIPVIIYFTYNGCLGDMLKCVFILGFRRSKDYAELFNIKWELKCLGAIFALVFAATHMKRSRKSLCVILLSVSAATYILFHLGTPFYYYFTSAYPCLILALALFLEAYDPLLLFESPKQGVCIALFSAFLLYYVPVSFNTIQTAMYDRYNEAYSEYKKNSQDLVSFIPSFERNQVFSFLIDMQFYEINDMMPCNKYVVNLPFFIALDENVMPELQTMMNEAPPKWIVSGDCLDLNIPEMYEILDSKYSLIYENEVGKLYILN